MILKSKLPLPEGYEPKFSIGDYTICENVEAETLHILGARDVCLNSTSRGFVRIIALTGAEIYNTESPFYKLSPMWSLENDQVYYPITLDDGAYIFDNLDKALEFLNFISWFYTKCLEKGIENDNN